MLTALLYAMVGILVAEVLIVAAALRALARGGGESA